MPFGSLQFGKIGVLVNFIIQKLKSKHLSQFSLVSGFFEGTRKFFYTYSGSRTFSPYYNRLQLAIEQQYCKNTDLLIFLQLITAQVRNLDSRRRRSEFLLNRALFIYPAKS